MLAIHLQYKLNKKSKSNDSYGYPQGGALAPPKKLENECNTYIFCNYFYFKKFIKIRFKIAIKKYFQLMFKSNM